MPELVAPESTDNIMKTYLVTLLDEDDGASFVQVVKAQTGYAAGAYAMLFDQCGEERVGGYKMVSAISLETLKSLVHEMENFPATPVGEFKMDDVEISDYAYISV